MRFLRFFVPSKGIRIGALHGKDVVDVTKITRTKYASIARLFKDASEKNLSLRKLIGTSIARTSLRKYSYQELDVAPSTRKPHLITPVKAPEVWACGVTYLKSREARESETKSKGIYDWIYEAKRPEIFFKATPSRCVGPNQPICIRSDSQWTVPEPELALIIGFEQKVIGYTIGNDVSARDVESENPLYVPQAKIYSGSCALGPVVTTTDEIDDVRNLRITISIIRDGYCVFNGETNTSQMKRSLKELLEYLHRDNPLPPTTVCLTGTGIVPPDDFTLKNGDTVEIQIEKIGTLRNPVVHLK